VQVVKKHNKSGKQQKFPLFSRPWWIFSRHKTKNGLFTWTTGAEVKQLRGAQWCMRFAELAPVSHSFSPAVTHLKGSECAGVLPDLARRDFVCKLCV
jgi:hypothetical protein